MSHIFISYTKKDTEFAGKIVDALAENQLNSWVDWNNIPKGENWEQEIYRGIEAADAFLVLISPDLIDSKMCNKEIAHATRHNKRIIPVIVRDISFETAPHVVSNLNWIFCRYQTGKPEIAMDDFNAAIRAIQETIHTNYEWVKFHTNLQLKALEWKRQQDSSWLLRGKQLQEAEIMVEHNYRTDPFVTELQRRYLWESRAEEKRPQNIINNLWQRALTFTAEDASNNKVINMRNLNVFLCHSSSDKPAVRKLYNKLTDEGFDIWLDEVKLIGGQDWEPEIKKAVKNSHAVLVCLSSYSVSKVGFVQKEIKYALDVALEHPDEDIYIIPVRLEKCNVPERLSRWHWIDLFQPQGYEKLVKALDIREQQIRSS